MDSLKAQRSLLVVGWREWIRLDSLCADPIKAKVDTGARTSSLHAFDLQVVHNISGPSVARFEIHPSQRSKTYATAVDLPIREFREVRSSSGHIESRPVVRTLVTIGNKQFDLDLTLTSRDEMGFRMLLGRTALRRRYLVDPGRSYVQGDPK